MTSAEVAVVSPVAYREFDGQLVHLCTVLDSYDPGAEFLQLLEFCRPDEPTLLCLHYHPENGLAAFWFLRENRLAAWEAVAGLGGGCRLRPAP